MDLVHCLQEWLPLGFVADGTKVCTKSNQGYHIFPG